MIWGFAAVTLGLLVLGVAPEAPVAVLAAAFALYSIAAGASNILEGVYPNELFPTDVRATGMGIATAISRIGAAAGTYLVPIGLDDLGVGTTVLIGAGVTAFGLLISIAWAPETRGLTLAQAGSADEAAADGRAEVEALA